MSYKYFLLLTNAPNGCFNNQVVYYFVVGQLLRRQTQMLNLIPQPLPLTETLSRTENGFSNNSPVDSTGWPRKNATTLIINFKDIVNKTNLFFYFTG